MGEEKLKWIDEVPQCSFNEDLRSLSIQQGGGVGGVGKLQVEVFSRSRQRPQDRPLRDALGPCRSSEEFRAQGASETSHSEQELYAHELYCAGEGGSQEGLLSRACAEGSGRGRGGGRATFTSLTKRSKPGNRSMYSNAETVENTE